MYDDEPKSSNIIGYIAGAALVVLAGFLLVGEAKSADLNLLKPTFEASVQVNTSCSGTLISSKRDNQSGEVETYILTAKHCTDGKMDHVVNVPVYNNKSRKVKTVSYLSTLYRESFISDLALLKLKDTDTFFNNTVPIAPRDISLPFGTDVISVSYPLGMSLTFTQGNLGYVETIPPFGKLSQTREFYRATPMVAPASSGSGMYTLNNNRYELIGTLTGGMMGFPFINLYTPIEEIREFVDSNLDGKVNYGR